MSSRSAGLLDAIAAAPATDSRTPFPAILVAALAATAAVAGMAIALIGDMAGNRAIYYVVVLALFSVGGLVTLTRKEPLRFAFLALVACFPIAAAEIPPGRFEIAAFHAIMGALAICLVAKKLLGASTVLDSFFPTKSLLIAWVLVIPCIVFSQFPLWSLLQFVINNVTVYIFLLFALQEMKQEKGFERVVLLLSAVLIVMAIGLYIDYFLHINLGLRGSNLNQSTMSESGLTIYRAGGFFQDPQRAGTYLACMITFLLLLVARGRFAGMRLRYLVWAAIAISLGALVTTIARNAILACLAVSAMTLFLFNKWNGVAKLLVIGGVLVTAIAVTMTPMETWLKILPAAVSDRFLYMQDGADHRLVIWLDTWDMFADHPITGIGISSFRPYLIETRPGVFNYYDIGTAEGVAYIPDQPESGYLKILYEGGILGSLAALVIVGDVLRRAIAVVVRQDTSTDARTELIAALAAIATFGATFVTLYTSADARVAGLFAIFLAVILHRSLQREQVTLQAARNGK